ncbi:MAG TPA: Rieske 2Fe-2S domain-containing protein [Candidatus Bathyarchaeia archaeon]|nr:Rieske 2Fe-2S domain-containing protein [Candidatus Bathyarchaeia archaeon]
MYVRVADKSEIGVGKMKKVALDDKEILIANVNGKYYSVDNTCTHFGGNLSEGVLEGNVVTCPNHRARFDVTTGKVVSAPAETLGRADIEDLQTHLAKVEDQYIMVKI